MKVTELRKRGATTGRSSQDPHSHQASKDGELQSIYFNKLRMSPELTGKYLLAMRTVRSARHEATGAVGPPRS